MYVSSLIDVDHEVRGFRSDHGYFDGIFNFLHAVVLCHTFWKRSFQNV